MNPTRTRTFARITFAIASLLAVPMMPAFVPSEAHAQIITQEDRCQAALGKTARKYLERVLKYRIRCENKVITGDLPLATDCLFGNGDDVLAKQLLKTQARLSVAGSDCNGVNLQLLGFPGVCGDSSGSPFDTADFKLCVLQRTDLILDELLDYYYPPLFERQRGDIALCLQGTPQDAADSLVGKMRARERCLVGQSYDKVDSAVDCLEKILPYGGGTGDEKTDDALARAYVELLGTIPKACAIVNINDLGYQSKCSDPTGGNFNIFDLKTCLFDADRLAALAELATVFPVGGICGDGKVTDEEECDNGSANSDTLPNACRTNCKNARCGDTVTDSIEQCDDGNSNNLDCCSNTCVTATCGDGIKNCGEVCDNGTANSDILPDACRKTGARACKPAGCGDDVIDTGEECDDGNTASEDLCSFPACKDEFCGDDIVQAGLGEECDNGVDNSDTAVDACRKTGAKACKNHFCGDGVQDTGEGCDDGNTTSGDGCSSACVVVVEGVCGDGIVNGTGEECDDGTTLNSDTTPDACRTNCKDPRCGDNVTDPGNNETCDDGNTNNSDACTNACGSCGDNVKQATEECDGSNDPCTGGVCKPDTCTCELACPTEGELILYAGYGKLCTTNSDCPVGTCDGEHCRTVTRLDSGWTGLAHDADINDAVKTRGFLECPGHGPVCGECNVVGIDGSIGNCRCANDNRNICDDPFATSTSDCPACSGGDRAGGSCATNSDCVSTCSKRCNADLSLTCTTNADCLPSDIHGLCDTVSRCTDNVLCTTNAECESSTCTATAGCNCFFGAPFPLNSGGTPACVVNRFSEDISGTANVDLGSGSITAKLRTQVHFGVGKSIPCPVCGGVCSNNPGKWCVRDLDCAGGTCNDDPIPDDGIRGGTCSFGGFFVDYTGTDRGKSCDKSAFNSSFPAFTTGPSGGWYSLDCMPFNNVSGQGLIINLTQTTGAVSLSANVPCVGPAASVDCPCLTCSTDGTLPCNKDSDCAGTLSTCSLGTGSNAKKCLTNSDCLNSNGGDCNQNVHKCRSAQSFSCTTNADCSNLNLGTCPAPTCSSKGNQFATDPFPMQCDDQLCTDLGGGKGECTTGPDSLSCDGLLQANGKGVIGCADEAACGVGINGFDAGSCSLSLRNACFLDPITAQGDPDPSTPVGAAVFCIPPTTNPGINSAAGLPGPGRVVNQAKARTFCGNDTTKQYIPGVGGCVEGLSAPAAKAETDSGDGAGTPGTGRRR